MLILGGNQLAAGGYNVDNSLRFDGTSNLTRTPASDGNLTTMTFSFWIKRSKLGTDQRLVSTNYTSASLFYMRFNTDNTFQLIGYSGGGATVHVNKITNRVFRDTSAWYHLVITLDSTNATADDRCKIFFNGERETSFATSTNPSLNQTFVWNKSSHKNDIGHYAYDGSKHFDGYMSEFFFIDGTALDATSFGEFDAGSGIWKPIDVSGLTFGTNGFYLPFENSAALGQDDSGNGNNYTENNLTSIDQSTDTPTNNFAVGNNLIPSLTTYSNGNLTVSNGASWKASGSTLVVTQGKWYAEMKVDVFGGVGMLFGVEDMDLVSIWSPVLVGTSVNGRGYYYYGTSYNNGIASAFGASYTTGDIIGAYLDMDNKFVYFSKNGVMQNSGDPSSGGSGTGGLSLAGTEYCFAYAVYSSTVSLNFGSPPFAITSGNADANGYGNFEYNPTYSGVNYYSLNTKNLAEFG